MQLLLSSATLLIPLPMHRNKTQELNTDVTQFTLELMKESVFWVNKEGIIENINQATCQLLSYRRLELIGLPISEIDPKLNTSIWKKHWAHISKESSSTLETTHLSKFGAKIPVRVKAHYINLGDQDYIFLVAKNLTDANRYQQLFEITEKVAQIGAWDWNILTDEVLHTQEVLNICEVAEGEVLDANIFEYLEGDSLIKAKTALQKAKKEGVSFDLILDLTGLKGTEKVIRLSAIPKIYNNKIIKLQGIMQDITARVRNDREMYLKDFTIDNSGDMVFWIRVDGSCLYVNDAVVNNLGYTKEELYQMNVWEVVPNYPKELWTKNVEQVKKSKRRRYLSAHLRKDGSTYPTNVEMTYLDYEGQNYICAIIRNEEATQEYKEQLQRVKFTVEKAQEMIFWLNEEGKYEYVNEKVCSTYGYKREELLNKGILDITQNLDVARWRMFWKVLQKQKRVILEKVNIKKNGQTFPVEITSNYIKYRGKVLCCSYVKDITKRKKREQERELLLTENQKLKEALKADNTYLQQEIRYNNNFEEIVSRSTQYAKILSKIGEVADTDATVLVTGETGTGKELVARAIHHLSNRNDRPLIKINCAALPANLIESELFGHERGAFTGAISTKIGRFELANKATLFLDEIGEMPVELQPKLLRVLQEGEFSRLGSNKTIKTDVRIIAATNRHLATMVQKGTFREDLYYRLNVFPIYNMPLRDRKEDIPLLVKHFLQKFSKRMGRKVTKVSTRTISKLERYDYPGNIRELENIIERAIILSKTETLDLSQWSPTPTTTPKESAFLSLEALQKAHILEALKRTNWKISGTGSAADLLGLNGKTLGSKMRKLGIRRKDFMIN